MQEKNLEALVELLAGISGDASSVIIAYFFMQVAVPLAKYTFIWHGTCSVLKALITAIKDTRND